jgi:hypothetical protein
VFENRHQSLSALAVISVPLSILNCSGATPRSATRRSSSLTVRSASMLRATSIASASRVNSSTMLHSFTARSSAVWSKLEVECPHVIGPLGPQPPARGLSTRRAGDACASAAAP